MQSLQDVKSLGALEQNQDFSLAATPIEHLGTVAPDQLVRVVGTVRVQQPGKSLTIRDETGQLTLLTPQTRPMPLGERVEAIGYPAQEGTEWRLRDSLYRRTASASPEPITGQRTLRLADQLRELPPDEAARSYPVQLSGVITWTDPNADFFYLNDVTGGICVYLPPGKTTEFGRGSKVTITGVSAAGKFCPVVFASAMQVLARIDLPPAKHITLEQALTGIEEAQHQS